MRGLFITGTDTGVGKTLVARALLKSAQRRGLRWIPFKPAESGLDPAHPSDAQLLAEAAPVPLTAADVCLYRFAAAVAPAVAAASVDTSIDLHAIARRAADLAARGDALLAEGAGGLLTPYAPGLTAADIAAHLGLPVLVVARCALGTINHTALTVAELRRRHLHVAGVLLVRATPTTTPDQPTNAAAIAAATGITPVGTLTHLAHAASASPDALADHLCAAIGSDAVATLLAAASRSG